MKRVLSFSAALVLSLSSLLAISVPKAFAATVTWDGGGNDSNMTTAENWTGDVAPEAGDSLVFPANVEDREVTNNFPAGTSFHSISFTGVVSDDSSYELSGNSLVLTNGITFDMTSDANIVNLVNFDIALSGDQSITVGANNIGVITGVLSGSGNWVKAGAGRLLLTGVNTFTGNVAINQGELSVSQATGLGSTSGETVINNSASLDFNFDSGSDSPTVGESITFNTAAEPALKADLCAGPCDSSFKITFSGTFDMNVDTTLSTEGTITITGPMFGKKIGLMDGALGSLVINSSNNQSATPNSTSQAAVKITEYKNNSPSTQINVGGNEIAIVTGTYGSVFVANGGALKGTGTVGSVSVNDGGTIAPGLSPGCLNTGDITFQEGSEYEFELGGTEACTGYDQIKVTGTVTLGDGTLNTVFVDDFKAAAGQTFTIIDNDGSDAVSGTFKDLAEGATFTIDGYVFKISYVGGDGNDVVLTVVSVPKAPNTGLMLLTANPLATLLTTVVATGSLLGLARRAHRLGARR